MTLPWTLVASTVVFDVQTLVRIREVDASDEETALVVDDELANRLR
jgi:hypothetical protein